MLLQFLIHFPVAFNSINEDFSEFRAFGLQQIDYWIEFKDYKLIDEELGCPEIRCVRMPANHPMTRKDIVAFLNNYEEGLELYRYGEAESSNEF